MKAQCQINEKLLRCQDMSVCSPEQNTKTRHNVATKYPFLIIFSKASCMTSALHLAAEESKKKLLEMIAFSLNLACSHMHLRILVYFQTSKECGYLGRNTDFSLNYSTIRERERGRNTYIRSLQRHI